MFLRLSSYLQNTVLLMRTLVTSNYSEPIDDNCCFLCVRLFFFVWDCFSSYGDIYTHSLLIPNNVWVQNTFERVVHTFLYPGTTLHLVGWSSQQYGSQCSARCLLFFLWTAWCCMLLFFFLACYIHNSYRTAVCKFLSVFLMCRLWPFPPWQNGRHSLVSPSACGSGWRNLLTHKETTTSQLSTGNVLSDVARPCMCQVLCLYVCE